MARNTPFFYECIFYYQSVFVLDLRLFGRKMLLLRMYKFHYNNLSPIISPHLSIYLFLLGLQTMHVNGF